MISLITISVIVGSISILFLMDSQEKQSSMIIDSRLLGEFNDGFAISSNFQIDEIFVDDAIQGISIKISPYGTNSDLALTDPLILLQKLYPDNNIIDIIRKRKNISI